MAKLKKVTEKKVFIELPQETINYIQGVDYEASSRMNILQNLAQNLGVKSTAYKEYQQEYFQFNAEYQLIKDRITAIYIPSALSTHELKWQLNFQTNLLEVTILCECGIDLVNSGEVKFVPNEEDDIIKRFATSGEETDDEEGCGACGCATCK